MAFDRLIENIVKTQNPSVVGLDPKLDYVPEYIKERSSRNMARRSRVRQRLYGSSTRL
jgi:orotidine-5'-phosphate decarboxylase